MRLIEWRGEPGVPAGMVDAAMRQCAEPTASLATSKGPRFGGGSGKICRGDFERKRRLADTCDKAAPAAAVMLHLRSCYVSKAAILTIPIPQVSVENRSPA